MTYTDLSRRALRSLGSAKARTLLTAAAIAVGTFALTLTLAASNGAESYVAKIISDNFDPAELIVAKDQSLFGGGRDTTPQEYDSSFGNSLSNAGAATQIKQLTDADLDKIKATSGVAGIRPAISVNLTYVTRSGAKRYVATAQAFNPSQHPDLKAGSIPATLGSNDVLLPEGFVSALGFSSPQAAVGQSIELVVTPAVATTAGTGATSSARPSIPAATTANLPAPVIQPFTVAAVLKKPLTAQPGTELNLFVSEPAAASLNDTATKGTAQYHKYRTIFVKAAGGTDPAKLKAVQQRIEQSGYVARSVKETQDFLNQIIGVLRGIVAAFGAIAIIASVFGIINTMYISVIQRTREIGLMKALGMRNRDVGRLFRFEAALIGLIGGLLGSALAFGSGTLLNPVIAKNLSLGQGTNLLIFYVPQVLGLIAVLVVVSTLAGWLPSRKAAKLDPIVALRTE